MGALERKNSQTTVSVRMSLQTGLLRYASLLEPSPSPLANDILEGAFLAVRADEPGRTLVVPDRIRQALDQEVNRQLAEEYHRKLFGTQAHENERAVTFATDNAGRTVPLLKTAKQQAQPYEAVRPALFGCVQSQLTEEVGALYETELMSRAAQESYDPAIVDPRDFFKTMAHTTKVYNQVYGLFLRDHLAREVVREVPKQFLPPS